MRQVEWDRLSAKEQIESLTRPSLGNDEDIRKAVADIIMNVRAKGDQALQDYTQRFDGVLLKDFKVSEAQINQSQERIDTKAKAAIDRAYENVKTFHTAQGLREFDLETMQGVACQRVVRPIQDIGLYVPGGTAPLISTSLMLGVPAQIAKCPNRVLCTPANKDGVINPHILYAAKLCGITQIFKLGGAQAIAAMAYGTESIPKVSKIFGPGNAYVTAAKILASQDAEGAAMDMPAGPSEVCVIATEATNPAFAAADLLSQAEHDTMSQVVLIATSKSVVADVLKELQTQLEALPRKDIAAAAITNSLAIIVKDMGQAIKVANAYAAEHLILCFDGADQYLDQISCAGSVFLGPWTPEAAGDYASGTNHVLPTYGYARNYSGLGVEAFQRSMTVQKISKAGIESLGDTIEILAGLEGLDAHARAVSIRRKG